MSPMHKGSAFQIIVRCLLCFGWTLGSGLAQQPVATTVGALLRNGVWEVGVVFSPPISRDSAIVIDHYSIPSAQIESLRYVALDQSVVLTVSGLQQGSGYSLMLTNLQRTDGTDIPATSVSFPAANLSWTAVGAMELGFAPDAVAVGTNGFDLISGGVQMRDYYDEATFAFETVTGDFDRKVRVDLQEPSSTEARAGLMVREQLDSGKERPLDITSPDEAFSRYIELFVTPARTAFTDGAGQPVPGANNYQAAARFYTGGIDSPTFEGTEFLSISNNAAPPYPDAWVRIRRRGQTFDLFRGNDGTNWTQLGSYTFPAQDIRGSLGNTLDVGPSYSPETGNIPFSANARRAFLAQFRDYGMASGNEPTEPPVLQIRRSGVDVVISWTGGGILQTSTTLLPEGWSDVPGAANPLRITPANQQPHQYFRVRL